MGIAINDMQANTLPPSLDDPKMTSSGNPEPTGEQPRAPRGKPYRNVTDSRSVSMLGVGMVIGAVIGAGIALLVAPASGHETRRMLGRRAGGLRGNPGVWGKLGRELRKAAAAKRKAIEIEARQREVALRRAEAAKV